VATLRTAIHLLLTYLLRTLAIQSELSVCVHVVSKVPLNVACERGDQCLDPSARCINSACRCLPNFFDRNGVCGTTAIHFEPRLPALNYVFTPRFLLYMIVFTRL